MSANNYIKIYKNEYDLYEVDVCDAETGIFTVRVGIVTGKTLEEAISFAQRYMEENEVEYGITFSKNVLQDTNPKE